MRGGALVTFCRVFSGRPGTVEARMVGVDRHGFDVLAVDTPCGEPAAVRLHFDGPVDTADGVRQAMIALLRKARSA